MSCCNCNKSKTSFVCGICSQDLCKTCTEFLEPQQLSYLKNIPPELSHTAYCPACYTEKVAPVLAEYEATMEKARQILVFDKSQSKETRLIKRKEALLEVSDCPDKNETILRLSFFAAQLGFNAIIDVNLQPKKVINGRYQHTLWSATAMPANVSDRKLVKDRSIWSNPN